MTAMIRARPLVIDAHRDANVCLHCQARPFSVCNAIDDADLERLGAAAVTLTVQPGHTFIQEGDPAEHFFNVTAGTAKLFKLLPDGRRQVTGFAGIGYFLGLAVSAGYAFSAEALEPVRICRFSRTKLRGLLDDFPALEQKLLEVASNELVVAQEQMLLLGRKTARERLASFLTARTSLLPHCAGQSHGAGRERIDLPMTRSDIADYLGLTIETVSRTLSRFKAEKLIEIPNHSEVVVLRLDTLDAIATGMT
jgi:CRP/FNR family transcriptional regulator, anaerobic regulatory protein